VCNRTYNCGSFNIPYPFWGDSRPEYCGQHGYNLISCRDNLYPVLRFEALEFHVLNISKSNRTLTIARLDLLGGPCPPPSVQFQTTTLNYMFDYPLTVENITLLYDCPPQDNIPNRFNCSQFGVSDGKINAYIEDESLFGIQHLPQLLHECKYSIKVPILRTSARDLLEDPQGEAPEEVLQQAMDQGFEVEYSDAYLASSCEACEASDGVCGSNTTQQFVCYCSDHVQSHTCPKSGMHAFFSSHFLGLGFLPVLFLIGSCS
jgi:hypothetical protein